MSSGKPRAVGNMHVLDFVNRQLVTSLSWNNSSSETSLGESYILTIPFTDI